MSKDVTPAPTPPLSMTAVVAFFTGVVAAILEVYSSPGFKPLALIAGFAALIVGVVAIVNARRTKLTGSWMAYLGAALGIVAIVLFGTWFLS